MSKRSTWIEIEITLKFLKDIRRHKCKGKTINIYYTYINKIIILLSHTHIPHSHDFYNDITTYVVFRKNMAQSYYLHGLFLRFKYGSFIMLFAITKKS